MNVLTVVMRMVLLIVFAVQSCGLDAMQEGGGSAAEVAKKKNPGGRHERRRRQVAALRHQVNTLMAAAAQGTGGQSSSSSMHDQQHEINVVVCYEFGCNEEPTVHHCARHMLAMRGQQPPAQVNCIHCATALVVPVCPACLKEDLRREMDDAGSASRDGAGEEGAHDEQVRGEREGEEEQEESDAVMLGDGEGSDGEGSEDEAPRRRGCWSRSCIERTGFYVLGTLFVCFTCYKAHEEGYLDPLYNVISFVGQRCMECPGASWDGAVSLCQGCGSCTSEYCLRPAASCLSGAWDNCLQPACTRMGDCPAATGDCLESSAAAVWQGCLQPTGQVVSNCLGGASEKVAACPDATLECLRPVGNGCGDLWQALMNCLMPKGVDAPLDHQAAE